MVIKGRRPLLLLFLSSTLLLAVSASSLGYGDVEKRCATECRDFKRPALRSVCEMQCKLRDPTGWDPSGGGSINIISSWFNNHHQQMDQCLEQCPKGDISQYLACENRCIEQQKRQQTPQIPREAYEKICRQSCEMEQSGQQQCQRRCEQDFEDMQQQDNKRRESRDPEQKYEQCEQSCRQSEERGQGRQQPQSCEQHCASRMSQHERQQMCQQRCQRQGRDEPQQQQKCQNRCEEQLEEQARGSDYNNKRHSQEQFEDPQREYQQCQQSCQRQRHGEQQQQCQSMCKQRFEEQQREQEQGQGQCEQRCQREAQGQREQLRCQRRCQKQRGENYSPLRREEEEEQSQSQSQSRSPRDNPYYFPKEMFESKFRSEEGGTYVLERFTNRDSKLLKGIKNYRLALLDAKPNTFVLPHHIDAESIYVVVNGRGAVTLLMQDNKKSFNIEQGDVIRVPSGATVYVINNNNDETLRILKLIQPVNNPSGRFEKFFPAGSGNPQSYYSVFSNDILESAFDTPREQLQRAFGQQQSRQQGMVMRASQEQLRALSQHASSPRHRGRESRGPLFNLPNQQPVHSNNFGKFFEARPEEFNQLQDMDVSVVYTEINQEAMMIPHYNSKAIYLMTVMEGSGNIEMACPHLANQRQEEMDYQQEEGEQGEQSGRYMKVTAQISAGDAFVIPAGHPVAIVAQNNNNDRQNQNLRLVGFGINARNNQRNFLAGQDNNIMRLMEREARQLAFGEEMEQIVNNQKQSYFVQARQGRSHRLSSILDFEGF